MPLGFQRSAAARADRRSRIRWRSRAGRSGPAPGREWWRAAPSGHPRAAWSRCRWGRRWCRRAPPAPGKSGARRVGEADDLVLDRRAVARAAALDLPGIHRRPVQIGPDEVVRGRRRAGDAAGNLRVVDALGQEGKRLRRLVAGLHLHRDQSMVRAVESRRRAGLEPAQREARAFRASRKTDGRRLADPAGRSLSLADVDQAAQERAGRQHHGAGRNNRAHRPAEPRDAMIDHKIVGLRPRSLSRFAVSRIACCMAAA